VKTCIHTVVECGETLLISFHKAHVIMQGKGRAADTTSEQQRGKFVGNDFILSLQYASIAEFVNVL